MNAPRFELGQTVWVAWANAYTQEEVLCPICFGKRFVTVILGDDSRQDVDCNACERGYLGSTGNVRAWTATSGIRIGSVTGIELREGGWRFSIGGDRPDSEDIFDDVAGADARRLELLAAASAQASANFELQFKRPRGLAWTIQYHRACIARLDREMEWHKAKLVDRSNRATKKAEQEAVAHE